MTPPQTTGNKVNTLLITSAIASSIGSFLFGFDTAVISGTTSSIKEVFEITDSQLGLAVSSALFGALAGAALIGKPCEALGRVKILIVLAALYLISALGCAFSWSFESLLVFRLIGGIAVGGASVVSPMYITEITPPRHRGVMVAVSQLNIVGGILAALISNYIIVGQVGVSPVEGAWRWMFGVEAVPAVLFLLSAWFIPESPRWLAHRGKPEAAQAILKKLGYSDAAGELKTIQASFTSAESSGAPKPTLFQKRFAKPLLLVFALAIFNQLDGINAILYYITDIFKMAGFSAEDAFKQSVIIGVVNLVFTIVGMTLIDRIGRKQLLLVGSVTFIASHALAAWVFLTGDTSWLAVLAAGGVVGSHAFSQGTVIWVCINELLPNDIRSIGASAACFVLWGMAILVSTAFPPMIAAWGGYVFLFFAIMMVVQFFFVMLILPETKGKSLEQIEANW